MHRTIESWLVLVNDAVLDLTSDYLTREDLVDFDYASCFEEGMTADETARLAMRNDPTGKILLDLQEQDWVS